ncbi:MAG: LytR family transcriptional regulator [Actinobacteria bacterium]|nr:MAG: LytR family transcriptional regulator [Actinomycetota bacterium]
MPDDPRAPRAPRSRPEARAGDADQPPPYTVYRAGPRLLRPRRRDGADGRERVRPGPRRPRRPGGRKGLRGPLTWRRALKWLALALAGWIVLSLVLFLISAQTRQQSVSDSAKAALSGGGYPLWSGNTVLVLGSDQRSKKTKEPGANKTGPSRSDVIMLIRTGGGASARLSIPRDTVVSIPGHGIHKINAAYAFGGAALAIRTVERFLEVKINHVVEVNFDNFPQLIDAMGGIDYTSKTCMHSEISGGVANGGVTLRFSKGTHHLDGKDALALARTRHNLCVKHDSDLNRAKRQQALFSGMKSRLLSPSGFIRLPWIAWDAPPALRSDMSGPTLMGLFAGLAVGGTPPTRVLIPSGMERADGGEGLTVSPAERQAEVQRLLHG